MPALVKPNESTFLPPPDGPQPAACYRIVDLGTQDGSYLGKPNRKRTLLITWELFCEERMTDGRPFSIGKKYTWSMSEKATLRKDLESWRGKAFADDDFHPETGFRLESILGKPCLLNIMHENKNDTTYANVKGISRLPKQMTVGGPTNALCFVWLTPDEFNQDAFNSLSDKLKETIIKSPEYRAILTGEPVEHTALHQGVDPDDEIPF